MFDTEKHCQLSIVFVIWAGSLPDWVVCDLFLHFIAIETSGKIACYAVGEKSDIFKETRKLMQGIELEFTRG